MIALLDRANKTAHVLFDSQLGMLAEALRPSYV